MMNFEKYEDSIRATHQYEEDRHNRYSPYCDLIYYPSSREPKLRMAMRVLKPRNPSHILVTTHGWHMSIPPFQYMDRYAVWGWAISHD